MLGLHSALSIQHSALLIAPLRWLDVLELQRLLVQRRLLVDALKLPRRYIREVLVVAQGLAVGRLAFLAEVAAAGLGALERVEREDLGKLEIVGDAAGIFHVLVQIVGWPRH